MLSVWLKKGHQMVISKVFHFNFIQYKEQNACLQLSNIQFNYLYSVYLLETFTFRTITFILIPQKGRFFAILARREQVLKENDDVIC